MRPCQNLPARRKVGNAEGPAVRSKVATEIDPLVSGRGLAIGAFAFYPLGRELRPKMR